MTMFEKGLRLSSEKRQQLLDNVNSFQLPESRFRFLNDHKGLRLGQRHVLVGTTGTGKSTLTRSLVLDFARENKVMLYSTEETLEDTLTMFALRGVSEEVLANIEFVFEGEIQKRMRARNNYCLDEWNRLVGVRLLNSESKVFFMDNITTSSFYDGVGYEKSIEFLSSITQLVEEFNVAFFVVAHTKKGVKDDQSTLIGADDVKGPTSLTMKAEYLYIYQQLTQSSKGETDVVHGILRVKKARSTGDTNGVYLLNYNYEKKEYFGDQKIPYKKFNEIYSNRVKLGQK